MRLLIMSAMVALTTLGIVPAHAKSGQITGLQIPRFVSLASSEVNMRVGPGLRYPIEWVFRRKSMPVEIVEEFQHWRKVRDWQGDVGWIHKALISGRRTVRVISEDSSPLRAWAGDSARVIALLRPGVIGRRIECDEEWCQIEVGEYVGWVKRVGIFGD